jgi:hypothetical protein
MFEQPQDAVRYNARIGSMLYKNITKNLLLVIFCGIVLLSSGACGPIGVSRGTPPAFDREASPYNEPQTSARVESSEITESSGIAASKCQQNVLWTHNDSGDGAFIFAMDQTGRDLGTWKVENADNLDWEDIDSYKDANGKCFLYVGDIGNRKKDARTEHKIYRVAEPEIPAGGSKTNRKEPARTAAAEILTFAYSDEPQDSETMMVHPVSGEIYVATKSRNTPSGVYKLKPSFGTATVRAEKIADITVPAIPNGFLTGGDIAPDGKRLVICDYFAAYEFSLPADAKGFDDIWKQKPAVINLGGRDQGEAICYSSDGSSLFATSEGKNKPLIRINRRQ